MSDVAISQPLAKPDAEHGWRYVGRVGTSADSALDSALDQILREGDQ